MKNHDNISISMEKIAAFCRKHGVEELSLFGSVLRDDFSPESDVDVMVKFFPGHGFTFENTPTIHDELEAIFGRRVDVIEKGQIRNPFRRQSIMKNHQVIYAA